MTKVVIASVGGLMMGSITVAVTKDPILFGCMTIGCALMFSVAFNSR